MTESVIIESVGHRGDGIANVDGRTIYVAGALSGERVTCDILTGRDRARLIAVETPSPERVAPFCPYFGSCGGCAIQHWSMDSYRAWKHALVADTLRQAGLSLEIGPLVDAHGDGRRRVTLHARRGPDGALRTGFAAAGSHAIVDIDRCPILSPALEGAVTAARAIADCLAPVDKPLDIQVTASENGLDIDVRGTGALPSPQSSALARLASTHRIARITRHGELIAQHASPDITMGRARLTLPPGSFLQATAAGEDILAACVTQACRRAKTIADLFCGVGPFALRLAERARIFAYDSDAGAVGALHKAATATKGLKPVSIAARDLFRRPLAPPELRDMDAVVFDPPRQGAQAQVAQLAASRVPLIVAVSCNVASFARDAGMLIDAGYRCDGVTPIDQFRHSPHVELVATFQRE